MNNILENDIKFLASVGEKRALLLKKELNIHTFGHLLYFFPYRYIDRTKIYNIDEIGVNVPSLVQIKAKLRNVRELGDGFKKRFSAMVYDNSGVAELVWFKGADWIKKSLVLGNEYLIFGKPQYFNSVLSFAHPEIENITNGGSSAKAPVYGVYRSTERLIKCNCSTKVISQLQKNLWEVVANHIEETLPEYLIAKYRLMPLRDALKNIHFPTNNKMLLDAQYRLKFEELLIIQLSLLRQKLIRTSRNSGFVFPDLKDNFNDYYNNHLPFELTSAQKRVLKEIRRDTLSGKQMNRLLQGDVGSGKTIVAFISMLYAIDNAYQCAIMVPTEILANQHFQFICEQCDKIGLKVALLTGSTKKRERRVISEGLLSGDINILVGTHALIEDSVEFKSLGYIVIDEQHRFGVKQRSRLWQKSSLYPHVLVMTATPIPRTLAMTLYGDLDISVIDELPPNRKEIKTLHYTDARRLAVFGFMRKEIEKGRQIYVVYPLVKESEKMDYKNVEQGYEDVTREFPHPDFATVIVHGQMKSKDKDIGMKQFVSGEADIMVATTVIEVGVNVPNASVMIIESAERFGLAQLHQLRGRVGRGAEQSYCILISSEKLSTDSRKRLSAMVETNDGFELAELDLKLRGYGDLEGTQQSGSAFDLKIANIGTDQEILQSARFVAQDILDDDPRLEKPQNRTLRECVLKSSTYKESSVDLSQIS